MAEYKITYPFVLNQKESEVGMERRFFRRFKVRIPRKLKKAARYGVERRIYPTQKETAFGYAFIHNERVEFAIVGKPTKWKTKARLALIKEERQRIARMWHRYNRMILWGV